MKKAIAFLIAILMVFTLSACSENLETTSPASENEANSANEHPSSDNSDSSDDMNNSKETEPAEAEDGTVENKILIAYFSYGENADLPNNVDASSSASIQLLDGEITGNTGLVADYIQKATGGNLFSIHTTEKYSPDYNTVVAQGQEEKNNNARPEISTHLENLDSYNIVFVGFPNWWYGMPMVMYSFFDEYDFSGKTIIPFCTSGGSAFSDAISEIKEAEPNATVLDGLHISGSRAASAENDINEWINGLDILK